MDPISISLEIELGALLLAVIGGIATWMNNHQQKAKRRQREQHHQELKAMRLRQHREQMAALRESRHAAVEAIEVCREDATSPAGHA